MNRDVADNSEEEKAVVKKGEYQEKDENGNLTGSGFLGSSGGAPGRDVGNTEEIEIEERLSRKPYMKSKQTAAIDGQIRRRINKNDIKRLLSVITQMGGMCTNLQSTWTNLPSINQ